MLFRPTMHSEFIDLFKIRQMKIPFQVTDWKKIPAIQHKGDTGSAYWQSVDLPGLRIRLVEYSKIVVIQKAFKGRIEREIVSSCSVTSSPDIT